jgi:hypothetical protein
MATGSFLCSVCGESHSGLPTDTAYTLPDVVWALPEERRAIEARWTADLCQVGEHYFIRCLLPIAFTDQPGYYGWGVWAEVAWGVFERYLALYEQDATSEPRAEGILANDIPLYGVTIGLPVQIQFGDSSKRPTLAFDPQEEHPLAREARSGMSYARYHEALISTGALGVP